MATKYWLAGHPSGRLLAGSATVDFGSIADGDELASDITVTAANTVSVVASSSGDTVDLGSGTVRVLVIPYGAIDDIIANL